MEIDTRRIRPYLKKLNDNIKLLCNNKLELAVYTTNDIQRLIDSNTISLYDKSKEPDFVICLNYNDGGTTKCISSISCKVNDSDYSIEFSSKTETIYEGKKYNLLLRSVLIILCKHIKVMRDGGLHNISLLVSHAINPISIYLLAKYFHAKNELLEEYIDENELNYDDLTFDNIKDFYESIEPEEPEFENEEEEAAYFKNNEKIGNPVKLIVDLEDTYYINQAQKIFNNIITRLKCPYESGGKRRTKKPKRKTKGQKRIKRKTNKRKL